MTESNASSTTPPPTTSATVETSVPAAEPSPSIGHRILQLVATVVGVAIVVAAVFAAEAAWRHSQRTPVSEDAVVMADTVGIASRVGGPIVALHVRQGDRVEAGELLFEIDPTGFDLAIAEAEAMLGAVEAQIEIEATRTAQLRLVAEAAEADVAAAEAQIVQRRRTIERLEPVTERGFSPAELLDEARTALETAEAAALAARSRARAAKAAVSELAEFEAQRAAALVALEVARFERGHCEVRAPVAGTVVRLDIAAGTYVMPGLEVFQIVAEGTAFVDALFREGQLGRMRRGDVAEVVVMTAPDRRFKGRVESIGAAVRPTDELVVEGIPFIRRELDWVRVAQRFPVRIAVEEADPEVFRMGASATVAIAPRGDE